ncbi:response regulator transcription factor [Xanthobacter autotrophicus]|jgi:DNA-binding response OmpR family regulator/DNA-binding CsgD family transcriptional regulator|uniref:response regulator transcription factor n=1 Tax=Xanthobacter autotrophicus TaxID=280 RepID=UPI000F806FA1|nr:response regulator transcription factor [Xanthobacter autotrophicus]RTL90636.1 response regulator transcription factor [Ancylobacter aquaticus]UDQ88508.1 response regulator transcription factor [Xanthobacter autotrophicus]
MMHSVERRDIVLVVDDSPETLSLLTDALEAAGATVLVATEGANALALVERITPDVVLMDAVMPGMDGFETCRRLKRNKSVAHVPVIFMTGLSETEQIVKGLEAGGVDYVTKPISPDELIARIRVHLANARQTHSARAALDAAGRYLLSANRAGRVLWSTPQATALLTAISISPAGDSFTLPEPVRRWLEGRKAEGAAVEPEAIEVVIEGSARRLKLSYVGQIGPEELLLRIVEDSGIPPEQVLKTKLGLTLRESEVLVWLARGKANRDIGEILGLSPRTVNKHLEQIYAKIGVENRAAATALAVTALTPR